ncbi:alpha/beta fold hydrolase [Apibacter raozihei]|uniref:YheT family hydrolase n=1 Tax=Apibacter raozihei TaxID=2500547 RepID=UPI000FE37610|nr:alpha/beta fold hydrolase [Apibacter raozihei]
MHFIEKSGYQPPNNFIFKNAHLSTIIPGAIKKYPVPPYSREKLELPDGDFLLLDWWINDSTDSIVIISHGLEGHSRRTYINSCADYFHKFGYSVLAWNQRSCGGEINRLPKLYHMGLIDDLKCVVNQAIYSGFKKIHLIGYSMGGIVTLNYAGKINVPEEVKSCITFSTPLNVLQNVKAFKKTSNFFYFHNFMVDFKKKLIFKHSQFPDIFNIKQAKSIKSFDDLDSLFTAPIYGFANKEEYYLKVSPLFVLNNIKTPTLIVNAENDPFLTEENYLDRYEISNPNIYFEKPKYGGHVGFPLHNSKFSWAEIRAKEFIDSIL